MKRTPVIAALVLSTVSTAVAQQQSVRPRDAASIEQAVQHQDQERIRAQIAADTSALRRIYADDFLGIGPTGVVRNKPEVIADFTSHTLTYQSITTAEVRVRVYGNTAVETGRHDGRTGQGQGRSARKSFHARLDHDGRALAVGGQSLFPHDAVEMKRTWGRCIGGPKAAFHTPSLRQPLEPSRRRALRRPGARAR